MSDARQSVRSIREGVPETGRELRQIQPDKMGANESFCEPRDISPRDFERRLKPLTARQLTAINLLTMGKSVLATAKSLGVSESTLHRWKAGHPVFISELTRRQVDLFDSTITKLRLALSHSVNELLELATSKSKYERKLVMQQMLHLLKPQRFLEPVPAMDPQRVIDEKIYEARRFRGEIVEAPISDEDRLAAVEEEWLTEIDAEETRPEARDDRVNPLARAGGKQQGEGVETSDDQSASKSDGDSRRRAERTKGTSAGAQAAPADKKVHGSRCQIQREHTRPDVVGRAADPEQLDAPGRELQTVQPTAIDARNRILSSILDGVASHAATSAKSSLATAARMDRLMPPMTPRSHFLPGVPWPDNNGLHLNAHGAGLLEHEGAIYLFGEHKVAGKIGNTAQAGVHVYRSADLYNWTDAGIALAVDDDEASDIVRGCVIERPKVIYNRRTKQFVMYFHLEMKGQGYHAARVAIAVAARPEGPYSFVRSLRPNAGKWPLNFDEALRAKKHVYEKHPTREQVVDGVFCQRDMPGGQMARDMTLFVDDDERAFLVCSAEENYTLNIHELSDDYLDFTGRYVRILPGGHNEAPAIFKHDNVYHLLASGCTGWAPNAARSATAPSLFGPWTPGGNPCVGVNPHNDMGPELTFGGQSTFIAPMPGVRHRWIAMFDVWTPENPIDGGYLWLPCDVVDGRMRIEWRDEWKIGPRSTSCLRGSSS